MTLNRWDPFTEMVTLRDAVNHLMEDAFVRPGRAASAGGPRQIPMDIYETAGELVIRAALPGVASDQVQINFEKGALTIRGSVAAPASSNGNGQKEGTWHLRELPYGEFVRTLRLPDTFDPDKSDAVFENGVLTLRMPRTEAAKPRQIQVRAGSKS